MKKKKSSEVLVHLPKANPLFPAHNRFCEKGNTFQLVKRPKVKLTGEDGNVFNLLGICVKALKKVGMKAEALELTTKVFHSTSYEEALSIMNQYCETY